MTDESLQPDPSLIGGVPEPPFGFLPQPVTLFQSRARRFSFLADHNELAPYLRFLAELSRLQARLAAILPSLEPIATTRIAEAAGAGMPPIDRNALAADPALATCLQALLEGVAELEMPEAAKQAWAAIVEADAPTRQALCANVLAEQIPDDAIAPHVFVAAAVQVHLAVSRIKCNTFSVLGHLLGHGFFRRLPVQRFSWPPIHQACDVVQLGLTDL